MAEALQNKPENKEPKQHVPKSRELFNGDINDAVIGAQRAIGKEISPQWWIDKVGNNGSTESILDRFDVAYAELITQRESTDNSGAEVQFVHPDYDEQVLTDMFEKKSPEDVVADEHFRFARLIFLDQAPTPQLADTIKQSLQAIEDRLGADVTKHILGGLEVVVGENLESEKGPLRGGRAFPHRKLVLLNGQDTQVSLGELDSLLEGEAGASEFKEDLGAETKSGTVTTVHEIGHVFDALTHQGQYGGDRTVFNGISAPTEYGKTGVHEDYAESFTLFILDPDSKRLSPERKAAIESDIEKIRQELKNN